MMLRRAILKPNEDLPNGMLNGGEYTVFVHGIRVDNSENENDLIILEDECGVAHILCFWDVEIRFCNPGDGSQ